MDTIFALSSGMPPAGIAVIRVSGRHAGEAMRALCGRLPPPRVARLVSLKGGEGQLLDRALALWFPGPKTVTGEDLAEFHLHGGRAVIAAVEGALAAVPGLRRAQAGEFTRRAFANGQIDLAEAEGLADLLSAETELQRRTAMAMAGGAFSHRVDSWRQKLLALSAGVEASLDFGDEDDVAHAPQGVQAGIGALASDLAEALEAPSAEMLREGFRIAFAGPPNAGKSTLFNALVQREAAITSPVAGTTRDVLTQAVAMGGIPFTLVDMAGLRDTTGDEVEALGIERAAREIANADLVLWLGPEGEGPPGAWEIEAQCDRANHAGKSAPRHRISSITGEGLPQLRDDIIAHARAAMPRPGQAAISRRQRDLLEQASEELGHAQQTGDGLIVAEHLRLCRVAFDRLVGHASTEDVLDALFGRFCIGK